MTQLFERFEEKDRKNVDKLLKKALPKQGFFRILI